MFLFKKDYKQINVNDIDNINNPIVIDLRTKEELKILPSKHTKNIVLETLLSSPQDYLDKNQEYYLLCHSGNRSSTACSFLSKQGYKVVNLSGGISNYKGSYLR